MSNYLVEGVELILERERERERERILQGFSFLSLQSLHQIVPAYTELNNIHTGTIKQYFLICTSLHPVLPAHKNFPKSPIMGMQTSLLRTKLKILWLPHKYQLLDHAKLEQNVNRKWRGYREFNAQAMILF